MKKYLWAGMAVLLVNINASGFKDIDKETDSFLSELRALVVSDELEDDEEIKEIEANMPESIKKQETQDDKAELIRKEAMAEAEKKEKAKMAEEAKKAEALEAQKIEEARIQKEKEARDAEQREVEAYEKKRAEKRAKEAQQKEALQKQQAAEEAVNERAVTQEVPVNEMVVDINVTKEAKEAESAADTAYQEAVQEMREAK